MYNIDDDITSALLEDGSVQIHHYRGARARSSSVESNGENAIVVNGGNSSVDSLNHNTGISDGEEPVPKRSKVAYISSGDDECENGVGAGLKKSTSRPKRQRIVVSDSEEEEEYLASFPETQVKFIRKSESTAFVQNEEKARLHRLAEKQKQFNGIIFDDSTDDVDKAYELAFSEKKAAKRLILDNDKKHPVEVHKSLVRHLKPHQLTGVQFLYNTTIESLDRIKSPGGGAILAHCMGLGKTLQTITFLYTILKHPVISKHIRKALIVCPKNVVLNWVNEFQKWICENDFMMEELCVHELDSPKLLDVRLQKLKSWYEGPAPAVMIIGYEMFRNLTQDYTKPNKRGVIPANTRSKKRLVSMQHEFRKYLQSPGPQIVICDEGHKLKNIKSEISQTMVRIETRRRICLTGTPMQNNLGEYYTMVNFIKPGLLGTPDEFSVRYVSPILAGQTKDASEFAIQQMRSRCYVLYEQLKGIIDRRDFSVLKEFLMPKREYVIKTRLTEKQVREYRLFLAMECGNHEAMRTKLLANCYVFARIYTHPYQIIVHKEEKERKASNVMDDFIVEDDDVSDESQSEDEAGASGRRRKRSGSTMSVTSKATSADDQWIDSIDFLTEEDRDDHTTSFKLLLMIEILKESETVGDKVLVFSQSLERLALIERTLIRLSNEWFDDGHEAVNRGKKQWGWKRDQDYMMITGSVSSKDRDIIQKRFNSQKESQIRLCLISTKAGSLGTNFVAANRVIIFDQNWNPSHDRQAMFRAYRFGQVKPVYVYRLVAFGTIEDRIYARQVTKEAVSGRVVDEHQIKNQFTNKELALLYRLDVDEYDPEKPPKYVPPEDRLLANVFTRLKHGVVDCLQHDSLLAHIEEDVLTEEERRAAWEDFEKINRPHLPRPKSDHQPQQSDDDEITSADMIRDFRT